MLQNIMLKFYEKKIKLYHHGRLFFGGVGASRPSYLIFVTKNIKSDKDAMLCVGLCFPQFNF